jgi:F0F1-type ATP synthase gamma subunit
MIKLYAGLGIAALVIAAVTYAYNKGQEHEAKDWQLKMAAAEKKISELESKAPIVTEKIVTEYVDRIKYVDRVKIQDRTITEYVTIKDDAACVINKGFVQAHNAAATLQVLGPATEEASKPSEAELSDVLRTMVDNYTKYHEVSIQLESLQEWIRQQKLAWDAVK